MNCVGELELTFTFYKLNKNTNLLVIVALRDLFACLSILRQWRHPLTWYAAQCDFKVLTFKVPCQPSSHHHISWKKPSHLWQAELSRTADTFNTTQMSFMKGILDVLYNRLTLVCVVIVRTMQFFSKYLFSASKTLFLKLLPCRLPIWNQKLSSKPS